MRKKIFLLILVLFIGTVSASEVTVEEVDRTATNDEPAKFLVNVENTFSEPRTFRISSIRSPAGSFRHNGSTSIAPGETETFRLEVRPGQYTVRGNYRFTVNVRVANEHIGSDQNYFRADSDSDIRIRSLNLENENILPGQELEADLGLLNIAPRTADYEVRTSLKNESTTREGSLSSGSERSYRINLPVDEDSSHGEEELQIEIFTDGDRENIFTRTVNIAEVEDYEIETQRSSRVLEATTTTTLVNTGNTDIQKEMNETVPRYLEPLTTFADSYSRYEEQASSNVYYWNATLEPDQQYTVQYTVRYWPPLIILGFIFAGVLGLKKIQTPVKFSKKVKELENGLKIHIEIENHSSRELSNLEVTDFVPNVAKVKDEFPMAKPVLRRKSNGTELSWDLKTMKPGEKRVLEYSIKPVVEVEEGIILSRAELTEDDELLAKTEELETSFKP